MHSIQNPEILLRVTNECLYSEYKLTEKTDILEILISNIISNIILNNQKRTIINDLNLFDYCDYCTKKIFKQKFYNCDDKTYYTDTMIKIKINTIEFYLYSIGNLNYFTDLKESNKIFMFEKLREKILNSIYFKSKSELISRHRISNEFTILISKRLNKYIDKLKIN